MLDSLYCRIKGHQWKYYYVKTIDVRYHPWNEQYFKRVSTRRSCKCCGKKEKLLYRQEVSPKQMTRWHLGRLPFMFEKWE